MTIQLFSCDIGMGQLYLPPENINSQIYLNNIAAWTENKKMKLNEKKTKVMIFNSSKKYQFATRLNLNNCQLETVSETHVLGTIIRSDLSWQSNTQYLVKRGYARMTILRNLYQFDIPEDDLVQIYCLYIRSVLEYNSSVWFSSITQEESDDLERVQKCACKIILKGDYTDYNSAIARLNIQTLSERRKTLAKKFAVKCTKSEKFKNLFPVNNKQHMNLRKSEKYSVNFSHTL